MPVDAARAKSLFLAASELADPASFLDRECVGDATLRARVDALLNANASASVNATATFDVASQAHPGGNDQPAGAVIGGKYKLIEVIGEGGMGSVWLAQQSEPVKRKVAVKLIKAGMDSKNVMARFEAERQALAMMDHPNIAKILDGGLHENRPYFVMELVKGVPITDYCDAQKLTPRQRLELFVPICLAIQHAHQKGIIHRDIKPNNVLIALYDDRAVPKVIDFGVAKATGGELTDSTIDTGFGGIVGTPQYMSPEQATFNNLDIDTRSDVYSLGVLLYELLAGSPPFAKAELEKRGLLEILRVVREEEPPRPSTKLSTAHALPSISASRGTEPKKLTGLLRNELDWIVMKSLEKDRVRRYETANGFAADIKRYLAGEAVLAHPPSTAYRLKKFARRHKGQVLAASLVVFALLAGIAGTSVGLIEAKRQERIAVAETALKEDARLQAVAAQKAEADRAEGERAAKLKAQRHLASLGQLNLKIFEMLGQLPTRAKLSESDLRAYALGQLDIFAHWADLANADGLNINHTLALTFRQLGAYDRAIERGHIALKLAEALDPPSAVSVIGAQLELSLAYEAAQRLTEAAVMREKFSAAVARLFVTGTVSDAGDILGLVAYLRGNTPERDVARRLSEFVVENGRRHGGTDNLEYWNLIHHHAWATYADERPAEAIALEREALVAMQKMSAGNPDFKSKCTQYAMDAQQLMINTGQVDPALFDAVRAILDAHGIGTAYGVSVGLAVLAGYDLLHAGSYEQAEPILRECLAVREKTQPDTWTTFNTQSMLGGALLGQKRYADAEPLLVNGYEGMTQRGDSIPPQGKVRVSEAVDRLVELYTATNMPDEVKKWQTMRVKHKETAPMPRK